MRKEQYTISPLQAHFEWCINTYTIQTSTAGLNIWTGTIEDGFIGPYNMLHSLIAVPTFSHFATVTGHCSTSYVWWCPSRFQLYCQKSPWDYLHWATDRKAVTNILSKSSSRPESPCIFLSTSKKIWRTLQQWILQCVQNGLTLVHNIPDISSSSINPYIGPKLVWWCMVNIFSTHCNPNKCYLNPTL
jgi:hypothetical protein